MSQFHSWLDRKEEDLPLRPARLSEFIGQKKLLENLFVFIESAKRRNSTLDHILLSGPPGLGKTTIAQIVATELSTSFTPTSAPAISKGPDLARYLARLEEKEVFFIDEIHGLPKKLEEILYPAMENYTIDVPTGEGVTAQLIQVPLKPFTLVGATTRAGLISDPLRSRFGIQLNLDYYSHEEMTEIVKRSAKILNVDLDEDAAALIGSRSRRTPRVANHLLKRVRDFAEVKGKRSIDTDVAIYALDRLGIDSLGLEEIDRQILQILMDRYGGGPVGLKSIAVILGQEERTLEDTYESYMVRTGLIDRTPSGRVATRKAYDHLGIKPVGTSNQRDERERDLF